MLTDAAALALALLAASLAARPAGGRWTFGFGRVEILAAQANGITLLLFGLWIVYEAVRRLIAPPEVDAAAVPERPRCVPAHRHRSGRLRRHGPRRRADPGHRLEPPRPDRVPGRRRAHVRRRLVAPAGVGAHLP